MWREFLKTPSVELMIPPTITGTNIPSGWAVFQIAPMVETAGWEELEDIEGRLRALASIIESYRGDALELEKALRLVDCRRGILLGPRHTIQDKKVVDASPATVYRWRKIAENWNDLVWPHIVTASHRSEVSQAEVLRIIDRKGAAEHSARVIPPEPAPPAQYPETLPPLEPPIDLAAEYARAEHENEQLRAVVKTLTSSSDLAEDYLTMVQRYAQLEGRLRQEMTTRAECQKEAEYAKAMLFRVRTALAVEVDREIIPKIVSLQTVTELEIF